MQCLIFSCRFHKIFSTQIFEYYINNRLTIQIANNKYTYSADLYQCISRRRYIASLHRLCHRASAARGAITMENLTAFDLKGNNGVRHYLLAQLFRRRCWL